MYTENIFHSNHPVYMTNMYLMYGYIIIQMYITRSDTENLHSFRDVDSNKGIK